MEMLMAALFFGRWRHRENRCIFFRFGKVVEEGCRFSVEGAQSVAVCGVVWDA